TPALALNRNVGDSGQAIFLGLVNQPTVAHDHIDAETEMMDVPGELADTMQWRTYIFDQPQEPDRCITASMPRSEDFCRPQVRRFAPLSFAFRPCRRPDGHIIARNEPSQARPWPRFRHDDLRR